MTAQAQFNIAMVLRSDVSQGKAGLADFTNSLQKVKEEAAKTGAATAKEAAELEGLAAAATRAARAQTDLVAAERNAQATRSRQLIAPLANPQQPAASSAAPVVAFWRASETAAASLRDTVAGLNVTVGQQAHELVATAQATAQWRAAMDDVRSSFNPLFAASRQYELQLERIAEAERLGAISAREAAAAREQAVAFIAPGATGPIGAAPISSMHTANVAAQGFDVGVTAMMGMPAWQIGMQQGTQLAQVAQQMGGGTTALRGMAAGFASLLSPMTLATIGIVTFSAVAIQWLMKLGGETKSFREAMDELAESTESYSRNIARARSSTSDLAADYGDAAEEVRNLIAAMAELDRRAIQRSASTALGKIRDDRDLWLPDLSWRKDDPTADNNAQLFDARRSRDRNQMRRFFDLDRSEGSADLIDDVLDTMTAAVGAKDKGIEEQIPLLEKLQAAWMAASEAKEGYSEKEDTFLADIQEALERLQKVSGLDGNEAGVARAQAITKDLSQQIELERARLKYGQDSAHIREIENRQEREALELKLEGLGLDLQSEHAGRALNALADLQRQKELAALDARREWFRDQDDRIAAIQRETALIGSTAAEQARINALAEAEVEIRKRKLTPLEAAEARTKAIARAEAEIAQTRARALRDLQNAQVAELYDTALAATRDPHERVELEAQREYARQIADGATAEIAAGHATLARARALRELQIAQGEYLRGQDEQLAKLRLELALVGQTAEVRARVLALAQAEQDIQRLGLDGELADQARRRALAQAELGQVIEAQADAWKRVQSAGESAIDGVLDKLRGGDIKGAMAEMLGEIEKGFFDLSIRNPLKNALIGTNLGTWEDVGGWAGIWGRFTGAAPLDEGKLARDSVLPLQTLSVTATNVILQGNLSGIPALGAANANTAPMSFAAGLPGSAGVQSQIWSFFAAKGLAPHQIAGIMGQAAAESGFNPHAVGDNGTSFGIFQHHAGRGQGLLNAVGGVGGLGNVDAQLEYLWQELLTSENGALRRLLASTNVQEATIAAVGFERPQGWSAANPMGAHNFDGRLGAAEVALAKFGATADTATTDLGTLGNGMGVFGQALQGFAQGGPQGGLTGLLGALGTGFASALGIPGFSGGGPTGGSSPDEVRGLVHGKEFVFDAAATARIGVPTLEAIRKGSARGFREGGFVGPSPAFTSHSPALAATAPAPVIQIQPVLVNNTGRPVQVETEETVDARGQRQMKYVLSDATADALAVPGGRAGKVMRSDYGIQRAPRLRP
ncbi:phage tail tip lysozyme [Paracoccus denitrificans]|uniref:phage tail tip lysozyme n=1 Tax=Paracoccus denitrificans TaxID=266 RepID=UPI0033650115